MEQVTARAAPMGWVWGMVYGNRNRTGVCGTWLNERAQLAKTPASRLRADGPADEIEAWEPLGEDAVAAGLAGVPDGNPNQQVWMEQQYKLFATTTMGVKSATSSTISPAILRRYTTWRPRCRPKSRPCGSPWRRGSRLSRPAVVQRRPTAQRCNRRLIRHALRLLDVGHSSPSRGRPIARGRRT